MGIWKTRGRRFLVGSTARGACVSRALDQSRELARQGERAALSAALREALERSGLTQAEFALRLGTSSSRLSTHLRGTVVPAATLVERAHAVAERAR